MQEGGVLASPPLPSALFLVQGRGDKSTPEIDMMVPTSRVRVSTRAGIDGDEVAISEMVTFSTRSTFPVAISFLFMLDAVNTYL